MKKQIYDEKNGLNYTLHGDYYLPDLEINEEEPIYGKYGIMRKQFLKKHRSARYQYLVLTGKLTEHLNQIDKEVREKVEMLVEQMAGQWGVTEELKMQNQMEWVRRMNNIKNVAEESVLKNILYEI
ncbi:TnpV protein [Faecalicatena sp. BF-R-105]|nr:TnpV protein [Faecalicatena sp. BF-R-105]